MLTMRLSSSSAAARAGAGRSLPRLAGLLLATGLAGCMDAPGTVRVDGAYASPLRAAARQQAGVSQEVGEVTYRAVDRLVDSGGSRLSPARTIAVGVFSNRQAPGASDAFGSFVADLVRTRLVQRGLVVTDLHAPSLVRVDHRTSRRKGRRSRYVVPARAVGSEIVTGTYTDGPGLTYVSLKVVSAYDDRILAAVDFAVPRTR